MAKKVKNKFRAKVKQQVKTTINQGSSYGYLKLAGDIPIFNVDDKRVKFDIMPYIVTNPKHRDRDTEAEIAIPGELWYRSAFKVHRNVGTEKDSVVCPGTIGKKCPICDYQKKMRAAGNMDKEELKQLAPKGRSLYCIIPKGNKKIEEKPHVWDISDYLFQNMLNEEIEENEKYAGFPDLEDGLTLKVRFEEKSFNKNTFYETKRIDFVERKSPYSEDIIETIPKLDDLLTILSYKELEAMFFELEDGETLEEKRNKKNMEDIPFGDNEDEDEDEDNEVEVEADDEDDEDDDGEKRCTEDDYEEEDEVEDEDEEEDEADDLVLTETAAAVSEDERCKACAGTGKNSKGRMCPACGGRGVVLKPKTKTDKPEKTTTKKKQTEECPHGHKFGKDCDDHDECDDCPLWEKCVDA